MKIIDHFAGYSLIGPSAGQHPHSRVWLSLLAGVALLLATGLATATTEQLPVEAAAQSLAMDMAALDAKRADIADLESRIAGADGITKTILETRLARAWGTLLEDGVALVEAAQQQQESGVDNVDLDNAVQELLTAHEAIADKALASLLSRVKLPEQSLSAAEQAAAYTHWFRSVRLLDQVLEADIRGIELSRDYGLAVDARLESVRTVVKRRAASNSILLEATADQVVALKAGVEVLPGDTELSAKLQLAEGRVASMAAALEAVIVMMDTLELDTTQYRALVLQSTGEITTDVLKPSVVIGLLASWWSGAVEALSDQAPSLLFNLFLFIVIVFIARKLANLVERLVTHSLLKSQLNLSELLRRMIVSIASNSIMVLGILIALSQVGITLGPLLAGLGVAGFVIGFALQDTLSNFASGMMILLYRPFDVGDLVEAGTVFGKVAQMSLVNTTIMTLDNQTIVVPNNKIWGDVIRNVTKQSTRRVDLTFGVSYSDDIEQTERVLEEIVSSNAMILKEPEALIRLHELGDSSVNFIIRAWTTTDDYWDVYWDLIRTVKLRFDAEGISIPFPQRDVHIHTVQSSATGQESNS
ncbi:mechanosensitive ion channel [Halieaceae bacterium IMCC14734]|uniref:Small-conductance mechanosensitive channel n=1 Tax=Candidatus Litorirhabdus singularis TaxID=2518993 RepID=A0ABT3TF90_9GAMM|nr:mechanosensitive ion channel domain-containing protein [Candidatus Litorirhabdus singularis]MCX2980674.1 mechanosensitive ion channel [Candidatus Litorirhabdus singularis]